MDFKWAESFPEIHKVCTLFNFTELSQPLKYSYKPLTGFMQDGPHCGLVALAMYLGNPTRDLIQQLLETAKAKSFSNNGEMFSAVNLATLAKIFAKPAKVQLYSGFLDTEEIKQLLLDGANLLVPYDTAKDNSPCMLNGKKAHWAIICGAIETESGFYVIARHGKVKNVAIWKLRDLAESNAQLNEVGTFNKDPDVVFNVPEGGIAGPLGLNCKSVILGE